MKIKKLLAGLLAALMLVSMAGCGAGKEAPATEAAKATEKANDPTVATEVVEAAYPLVDEPITVTGLTACFNDIDDGRKVWDMVADLTGVKFEWIQVDEETLPIILASGDWEFDFIHYNLDSTLIADYGVDGAMFADYNDYLKYMPNLQATFEEYPVALKAVTQENGAIYNLPNIVEAATGTQVRPYFNPQALEDAGLSVPTTVDEFYNCLKVLKEKNGVAAWCPTYLAEDSYFGSMLYAAFGDDVNPDFADDGNGNVIFNRTSDQYKHYLEFMNKLYEEELIDQEFLTAEYQYLVGQMNDGNTAFWGQEAHALTADVFEDGELHLDVLAPLTSEYSSTQKVLAQLPVSQGGFFLNAESPYLKELAQVFDIMYATEEVAEGTGLLGESFTYGQEGVDYILNDDGTYEQHVPEGYEGSFTDYQYKELVFLNAGLETRLADYVTSTPGNGQVRQKGFIKNIFPYACDLSEVFPANYLKFTEDEQYVITSKYADVKEYVDEMKAKFITGVADIETDWDAYIDGLYARGLEDVLAVYQSSYDRWNQ